MIIRFDTLPQTQVTSATDGSEVPITEVDSAALLVTVDSAAAALTVPATITVYDVDSPGGSRRHVGDRPCRVVHARAIDNAGDLRRGCVRRYSAHTTSQLRSSSPRHRPRRDCDSDARVERLGLG